VPSSVVLVWATTEPPRENVSVTPRAGAEHG